MTDGIFATVSGGSFEIHVCPVDTTDYSLEQSMNNRLIVAACVAMAFLVSACATPRKSTALRPDAMNGGVTVVRALPKPLPEKSSAFPNSQFVLIGSESALKLLNPLPVPFIDDVIESSMHHHTAETIESKLTSIDPYRLTLATFQSSPMFGTGDARLKLNPFVVIQECADDRFRVALVYHVEGAKWVGRYFYHLPTAYPLDRFSAAAPDVLEQMSAELRAGAGTLRSLMERDARTELRSTGARVDIGSLHFVGGRVGGFLSPTLVKVPGADLLQDDGQIVVVRVDGDMKMSVDKGGLYFGVHHIRKDQLHTFQKL